MPAIGGGNGFANWNATPNYNDWAGQSAGSSAGPGGNGMGNSQVFGGGGVPQGMMAYGSGGAPGYGIAQKVGIGLSPATVGQWGIQKRGQDIGLQEANIAAEAQKYPATLAQQRFNQVFPFLQQKLGQFQPGAGGASSAAAGQPRISTSPIWNPQQIQQQINQSNASSDAATQSQQRQLSNSLGGIGFGANSPLAQALGTGMANANLGNKTQNATNIGLNAAQQNAQYVSGQQQASERQYAQRQQESLQAQQILASQSNALLAALASMSH